MRRQRLRKSPRKPCPSGTDCITFIDPACFCAITDEDSDGIDSCPGEDDKIDENGNGRPDCIENCVGESEFDVNFLRTNSATPSAETVKNFETPVRAVQFTVFNIGRKKNSYEEKVSVYYQKGGLAVGEELFFGDMDYETLNNFKVNRHWTGESPTDLSDG